MSTLQATNLKNAASASNNIVLDTAGNATVAGTMAMGSSYLRNRIINGDMRIDQRNAGASVTPTADATYLIDRWQVSLSQASKFSVQQSSTAPVGHTKSAIITSLSAYSVTSTDYFMFNQVIEGFNVADLGWGTANAQTVTLSFWTRSSLTGTFGGAIQNSAQNRSYPFSYAISAANTWEQKTVTIAGDTSGTWPSDNTASLILRFGLGVGSTKSGTAGSWAGSQLFSATGATSVVGTNGATWYITGVQLEPGTVATPFERRQYGQELALCQRYYEKGYPISVVPGTASNATTNPPSINFLAAAGSSYLGTSIPFKVTKRIVGPTITTWDNSGNSGKISTNAGANQTVIVDYISDCSFRFYRIDASTFIIEGFWAASAEL